MNLPALKQSLIESARRLDETGLNSGTSGNLSVRTTDGLLITPSGIAACRLLAEDLVLLSGDGRVLDGRWQPSSEWRIHCDLLAAKPDCNAVVHAHPVHATALACLHRPIPAFHYMVAVAGGGDIPCAGYATFGSAELSRLAVEALAERKACLLANHGLVATGTSLRGATELAMEVERLAEQYCAALQIGEPLLLSDAEMERVLSRFAQYGSGQHR